MVCSPGQASSFVVLVLGSLLSLGACGGGAASSPQPETPTDPSSTQVTAPEASSADEPGKAGDDEKAATAPAAGDAPPEDVGEGDTRTTEAIAAVVKANRKQARDCYEKALKQQSGLKGDVVIHFTLTPSGKVKLAELNKERSTLSEASVVTCVIGVINGLSFPESSKGLETTVNYPFNFNP